METARIVKEQRDLILQKYGFNIKVEDAQLSDYKYTINYNFNGGFTATIYRNTKDELDSLLQLIKYMDSVPYKVAYATAFAYDDCFNSCLGSWATAEVVKHINKKRNESMKVEIVKDFAENGIDNIESLHCNNILVLEKSRKALPQLFAELKWLKEAADHQQVDYEALIPVEENSQSEI